MSGARKGSQRRETRETRIDADVVIDGSGTAAVSVPLPFFGHMLETFIKYSGMDVRLTGEGDVAVDAHHLVEDCGLVLGSAVADALGTRDGIQRFGHAYAPLDEALSRVVIDLSGRPGLEFHVAFVRARIGEFDVDLTHEFFQGFVNHAHVTLHIDNLRGQNAHHQAETVFKAFARALRMAIAPDPRVAGVIPSTKGTL